MDVSIQRALNDKLYDKRKVGALEYELALAPQYCGAKAHGFLASNALLEISPLGKITIRLRKSSNSYATTLRMPSISLMPEMGASLGWQQQLLHSDQYVQKSLVFSRIY
jgi:hypothetical protein